MSSDLESRDARGCQLTTELRDRIATLESQLAAERSVSEGLRAARDAWRDYAEHAAHCVECGQTSWENCFDGKSLREAAEQADRPPSEVAIENTEETGFGIRECRGHWHVTHSGHDLGIAGDPFPTREAALAAMDAEAASPASVPGDLKT